MKIKQKVGGNKLNRKQARKQERLAKKSRRNDYFSRPKRREAPRPGVTNEIVTKSSGKRGKTMGKQPQTKSIMTALDEMRAREKVQQNKLEKEMAKQRKQVLKQANVDEDRTIKKLEKQLKLNKRSSKTVPKSFSADGLDYLLEVCDADTLENVARAEQRLEEGNNEFEEDFALVAGSKSGLSNDQAGSSDDDDDFNDDDSEVESETEGSSSDHRDLSASDSEEESPKASNKRKIKVVAAEVANKKPKLVSPGSPADDGLENDFSDSSEEVGDSERGEDNAKLSEQETGTWQDIYGRLRASDGSVIEKTEKYVPPGARTVLQNQDKGRLEKLSRLQRQLKGLLNRLAESNLHSISTQIESLYMNNSRNDMNNTITNLILNSLITNILSPERLLMEHVVLIAILHANVGTEVGAHFLQTLVIRFNDNHMKFKNSEDKTLDNIVNILAQLYNFKLFDSQLIFDVLNKLLEQFDEKDVECILHILKSVGFNLRKDDPIALKNFILAVQKKAAACSKEFSDNARVKFMLDILLAIKNNNVSKIPNYDTSHSEHLKKIMKGFIRKGNYVIQLNISLGDLLKAEERGRWWVVGSAWKGSEPETAENQTEKSEQFSDKLLELARKQRMNTDTRRNIFCIIMSSEDYLDSFEKLLRLDLKNQQDREIIHVILHCCLQEKIYNPFYSVLAQKFCDYDRKYQMTIKYSVWDKLKALKDCSGSQISNLAKLLTHLFIENGLCLSVLKVVQFGDLDKVTLRFMRQVLLGILLHEDTDSCQEVFNRVAKSDKLKMFKESLRLFIHHFLLRNLKAGTISDEHTKLLKERVKQVEKLLSKKELKF